MNKNILTIEEYKDSTDYFFRKEIKFMIIYIYLLGFLITFLFVFFTFFKVELLIKSKGIVRPEKKISSIVNPVSGYITKLDYKTGDLIKKGTLIYQLNTKSFENTYDKNLKTLTKLNKAIKYLSIFKKSILKDRSYFKDDNNQYYHLFQKYSYEKRKLKTILSETQMIYSKYQELGNKFVSEVEMQGYKRRYEESLYSYKMLKVNLLSKVDSDLLDYDLRKQTLIKDNKNLKLEIEKGRIISPITGYLQQSKEHREGDFITTGTPICSIIPLGSKLRMEIAIANKDISKLKIGQLIHYRLASLDYKEYGMSEGEIIRISPDSNIAKQGFFTIEGTIDKVELKNKKGIKKKIKIGMFSNIRIVTGKKTILRIILEKLNYRF